jgi:hypothetical protein
MTIPVVMFHLGYQPYIELCVKQASINNKIIFVGDKSNQPLGDIQNVEHFLIDDYNQGVDKFVENYKHMATSGLEYTKVCFTRWFYCRNVLKSLSIDRFFHSDSDNLIYSNIGEVYDHLGRPDLSLSVPMNQPIFRDSAAATTSFWTMNILEDFCNFMLECYTDKDKLDLFEDKWDWHQEQNLQGGVIDMTALWHYVQDSEHSIITKAYNDEESFDHNMNSSENYFPNEYQMEGGFKKITFLHGQPYGHSLVLNKKIKFHTLHFQGSAKRLMSNYMRIS